MIFSTKSSSIHFRAARREDGANLWRLVRGIDTLELNSAYYYLTFAQFFGETCLIAEQPSEATGRVKVVGCAIAFLPPQQPDAIFVWQIGVAPELRQQGLGKQMLHELLCLPPCRKVRHMLATITPDNHPSRSLFQSFAQSLNVPCGYRDFYTADLFPEQHEAENLFSIGPIPSKIGDRPQPTSYPSRLQNQRNYSEESHVDI